MGSKSRIERVRAVADRQVGKVSAAQLVRLGVTRRQIHSWTELGLLARDLPGVYALGHSAPGVEAAPFAAVLYAGPGAMLSHATAAWWRRLIEYPPAVIHVSTPRGVRSLEGIHVHARRRCARWLYRGMPVTSVSQTVLDLAATTEPLLVRKALGRLDFTGALDLDALAAICGSGRAGSSALRWALAHHDPRFGRTNGRFEDDWIVICETFDIPKPDQVNERVHGILVDARYAREHVVVELDGENGHRSWAQSKRDRRNDRILRSRGETVLRYDWDQIHRESLAVRADVLAALARGA